MIVNSGVTIEASAFPLLIGVMTGVEVASLLEHRSYETKQGWTGVASGAAGNDRYGASVMRVFLSYCERAEICFDLTIATIEKAKRNRAHNQSVMRALLYKSGVVKISRPTAAYVEESFPSLYADWKEKTKGERVEREDAEEEEVERESQRAESEIEV